MNNQKHNFTTVDLSYLLAVPTLRTYIARVGAEMKHFRRYVIELVGEQGYRRVVTTIKIDAQGAISLKPDIAQYQPTKEESDAIKAEVAAANWPRSHYDLPADADLPPQLRNVPRAQLFFFLDRTGKRLTWIQHRIKNDDGTKSFIAWSPWSDGEWRCMEPECENGLPLWGLEELKDGGPMFFHEGAGPARYMRSILASKTAHPYRDALSGGVHLGWASGALQPWRCDWGPIIAQAASRRGVLICDNDLAGKRAARIISAILKRPLEVFFFDDGFPIGFDMADPFPDAMYDKEGNYTGPQFRDGLRSGTWATDEIEIPDPDGKKKPTKATVLRNDFVAEWLFTVKPMVFCNRKSLSDPLCDAEFDRYVRPFSDCGGISKMMLTHVESQLKGIIYSPAKPPGIANDSGGHFNRYRPSDIEPVTGVFDAAPWIEFMTHLIPDDGDRAEALKWVAMLFACPDVHMMYGMLLLSEPQGVGKGTLMEKIIAPIVGWHNASVPSEELVTQSQFNGWLVYKRVALIHEIYVGESKKAYNKIKSYITERMLTVQEKYQPTWQIENWCHIVASSNSPRALAVAEEDRRWFVPGITDQKREPAYWVKLNHWLETGGLGHIAAWAVDYVAKNGAVGPADEAPMSARKKELILDSISPARTMLRHWCYEKFLTKEEDYVVKVSLICACLEQEARHGEHPARVTRDLEKYGLKTMRLGRAHQRYLIKVKDPSVLSDISSEAFQTLEKEGNKMMKNLGPFYSQV